MIAGIHALAPSVAGIPPWLELGAKATVGAGIFIAYIGLLHRQWFLRNVRLLMDRGKTGETANA